ncbi:MAG: nuclear transport factor 2 family protein [Candidatus Sericytochromatia bacterium]|nr:nuclear transport factor 2 family protein [Candidatus Tanganyikabacteria bacterium]
MDPLEQLQLLADEVRSANAAYYRALENRDVEALARVWSRLDDVKCVHPGWRLLRGWPAIKASYKRRFDEVAFQKFGVEDQFIEVYGDLGVVAMTEVCLAQVQGVTTEARYQATNLFRREQGDWRLFLHHASPRGN